MKKYFLHEGTTQSGPFDFEELKTKNITAKTMVWYEPLPAWKPAGEVEELKGLFNSNVSASQTTAAYQPSSNDQFTNQLQETNQHLKKVQNLLIGILISTAIVAIFILILVSKLGGFGGGGRGD